MKRMNKIFCTMFLLLVMVCGLLSFSHAAVPHLINYQGRLTDTNGVPLNGSYSLTFKLYDAESGGNMLWEETHTGVVVQKGIFSIMLGSVTNLNLPFDAQYFLEIKVGNDVMSPRQRIAASAYAIKAEKAEDANTVAGISASTTPTANKILPLDSNAKMPFNALGLKVYDSGWFAVSNNGTNYTKTHNLGTTKVICQVWFSPNSDGSSPVIHLLSGSGLDLDQDGRASNFTNITNLTNSIIILTTGTGYYNYVNVGTGGYYSSGYCRIIMLALE